MNALFKRELGALMRGVSGWLLFASVPLAFAVAIWMTISSNAAEFSYAVRYAMIAFVLVLPICAANGFSADKRSSMDRLLHSLPVRGVSVVLGKFFALCVPFLGGWALSCLYPVAMSILFATKIAGAYSGMLLYALCGMSLIALGLWLSCATKNAFVNVLIGLAVLAFLYYCANIAAFVVASGFAKLITLLLLAVVFIFAGRRMLGSLMGGLICGLAAEAGALFLLGGTSDGITAFWRVIVGAAGVTNRFNTYSAGLLDIGSVVYFLLATALLLLFSTERFEMARLSGRGKHS